ncbi:MAG: DNA repair protein RadA/Sms [Flavobacteriales bacterium]|jgi:DNA repair protein RadA/Sms
MAKTKTSFFCQNCGAQQPKWMGQCNSCNEWNTLVEEVVQKGTDAKLWNNSSSTSQQRTRKPIIVGDIPLDEEQRWSTGNGELDRVLGGGLVPGSMTLLGGEPGIGKSTLMLQIALEIKGLKTLYVSGEESEKQIRMRAERLGAKESACYILNETLTKNIFVQIEQLQPNVLIIDSIQTLHSDLLDATPGTISQIKECTAELLRFAKESGIPVILIGHITKDGQLAGPKVLEHMVDTVLQFEGDRNHMYRLLRTIKNRFGSTSELGIYEMRSEGLREVTNPSEVLISKKDENLSGVAIATTMEGMRPMLIEIQSLVSSAVYGTPQRSSTGFDLRRLGMLLAVLEKRCGFRLGAKDVFLNITGGLKVDDPATDLAVVVAVLSSSEDIPVDDKACFAAEVGLAGEIRPVPRIEQRISEAEKLGFDSIFISRHNKLQGAKFGIKVIQVGKVEEVFKHLFG